MVQEEGNLNELSLPKLQNEKLQSSFELHKKQIFNVTIFKEMLKSIFSCLTAK